MRMAANTYQLNVGLGAAEAVSRLSTYKTEPCVTLVHDRTINNNVVTDDDMVAIFQALSEMPVLQKLRVDFVGRPLRLPVTALGNVLRESRQLKQLVLEDVRLAAESADDLEAVSQAIREHPALEIVDLHCCVPADGLEATLDPLVTALAQVPTLTEVLLRDTRIAPRSMTQQPQQNNGDDDDSAEVVKYSERGEEDF